MEEHIKILLKNLEETRQEYKIRDWDWNLFFYIVDLKQQLKELGVNVEEN